MTTKRPGNTGLHSPWGTILNPCKCVIPRWMMAKERSAERDRIYYYCGKADHFVGQWPFCAKTPAKENSNDPHLHLCPISESFHWLSHQLFTLKAQIKHSNDGSVLSALIDLWDSGNFMTQVTVNRFLIPCSVTSNFALILIFAKCLTLCWFSGPPFGNGFKFVFKFFLVKRQTVFTSAFTLLLWHIPCFFTHFICIQFHCSCAHCR